MDLQQLLIFKTVVETKSFTRAANNLFLTQPAISHQIRGLEEELGQRLLERERKRVHPTDAGEVFYDYTRRIVSLVEESKAVLDDLRIGRKGRVSVAAIGTMADYVFPDFMDTFRTTHPGIQMILRTAGGEEVKEMVASNAVDLGVLGSHIGTPEFTTIPLFKDQILPFVHLAHPAATAGRATLAELAREPLIQLGSWKSWKNYIMSLFSQIGVNPDVQFQLDSIEAVKRMVEKGLGFTIIPRLAAEAEIQAGTLVPIELIDIPPFYRDILLIYRKDKYLSTALRIFLDALTSTLSKDDWPITSPERNSQYPGRKIKENLVA
ncbi:MAG: LysR family transcriptional regulator [Candidatus Latescibacteria bacterium]|nr:LysR family transcriptional regulator [Candidatus Latescibacterota bacterium]